MFSSQLLPRHQRVLLKEKNVTQAFTYSTFTV